MWLQRARIRGGYSQSHNNLELLMERFRELKVPFFKVQSQQVQIVKDPMDFYFHLYKAASASSRRIGLSSLYLGTGTLQRYLLKHVSDLVVERSTLNVRMLFDYHRSKRVQQGETGIEMVEHAVHNLPKRIKAGYLTENRSPFLKLFSKGIAEVIGVHHMKLYVFDDTTIITGANLSHSYFTRRQDRCVMIKDCRPLAGYFYDLISCLVDSAYLQVEPGVDSKEEREDRMSQYYKLWRFGNRPVVAEEETSEEEAGQFDPKDLLKEKEKEKEKAKVRESVEIEVSTEELREREDIREKLEGTHEDNIIYRSLNQLSLLKQKTTAIATVGEAVYLFPTVQINSLEQRLEKNILTEILAHNIKHNNNIKISSGYMNLPTFIIDILMNTQSLIPIITSAPKANSFFEGGTFKKYIPYFYRAYEHFLLKRAESTNTPLQMLEYQFDDWTFHAKGIWIEERHTDNMLTMVGSSNYNHRSYERDTECQLYIYSTCPELNQRFKEEWQSLATHCEPVTSEVDHQKQMKLGGGVKTMARIFNKYL